MALAKDQTASCSFYGNMLEAGSSVQFPHISSYEFDDYIQKPDEDHGLDSPNSNNMMMNNQVMSHSPPLSSSSSANSSNGGFATHHHHLGSSYHEEGDHSLINFKTGFDTIFMHSGGSFLSFQHEDHYQQLWEGNNNNNSSMNQLKPVKNSAKLRILDEVNCLQTASNGNYQDSANDWLYVEANVADPPQESGTQQTCFNKRPHMEEENMQGLKKQCTTSASKKPAKPKPSTTIKDPQSIAAKNRRERISERLKILQDLVPNGSKVDLVTMLEKAISYVKFLQLQVKVLATDEFWPAAGGKAPDISQVREAIDAILSSQRSERTTSSSK